MAVAEQSKISRKVDKTMGRMYSVVRKELIKCKENGVSLSELARETGVARSILSELANDRQRHNLSLTNYVTICEALDIKVTIGSRLLSHGRMVGGNQAKMMIMAVAEQSKISRKVDKTMGRMYDAIRKELTNSMESGMSLSEVSRQTGIARYILSQVVNERRKNNLSLTNYVTICEALDIKVTIG